MATFHPATWHGLDGYGAIAPGYVADLLVLPDLVSFLPDTVLKRGRPLEDVAAGRDPRVGTTVDSRPSGRPDRLRDPVERRRGARDRADRGPGRHGDPRSRAVGRGRAGRRRPRARPGEDRGRRAAPRHRPGRARLRRRLGPPAGGARLERRPRRAQHRRRRHERPGPGVRGRAARRDRRRHRRRERRERAGRVPAPHRRAPLRRARWQT